MTTAAIIVAAGAGHRFGYSGKSFASVLGKPMAWWSLIAAANATAIDELVLVCGEHSQIAATELIAAFDTSKPVRVVLGGERRQDSALAGIHATSDGVDLVVIHDAARPFVSSELFDAVVLAARTHGAAITAIPVSDTIKQIENNHVVRTIPRDGLVRVQTPQAFGKQLLLQAFACADEQGMNVTDEASLIEQTGGIVVVIPGLVTNLKITYPDDLTIVEELMRKIAK